MFLLTVDCESDEIPNNEKVPKTHDSIIRHVYFDIDYTNKPLSIR